MLTVGLLGPQYCWLFAWYELGRQATPPPLAQNSVKYLTHKHCILCKIGCWSGITNVFGVLVGQVARSDTGWITLRQKGGNDTPYGCSKDVSWYPPHLMLYSHKQSNCRIRWLNTLLSIKTLRGLLNVKFCNQRSIHVYLDMLMSVLSVSENKVQQTNASPEQTLW